jgi:hypothetical protein
MPDELTRNACEFGAPSLLRLLWRELAREACRPTFELTGPACGVRLSEWLGGWKFDEEMQ